MTVRLLAAWGVYPQNAIIDIDDETEAGLVAAKLADTDTTGGVVYVAPTVPAQIRAPGQQVIESGKVVALVNPDATNTPVGAAALTSLDGYAATGHFTLKLVDGVIAWVVDAP